MAEKTEHINEPVTCYYEGENGAERIVRAVWPDGTTCYYDVGVAQRLYRTEYPNGATCYYEGDKGAERFYRAEYPNGIVGFYEGDKGAEHKVRVELPDGRKHFFEGEKGTERMIRTVWPFGETDFFEGEKGAERKVRTEIYDGEIQFFSGRKGFERKVRAELPDAHVTYYGGHRDHEYVISTSAGARYTARPRKGPKTGGDDVFVVTKKSWEPESEEEKAARVAKNRAMVAAMGASAASSRRGGYAAQRIASAWFAHDVPAAPLLADGSDIGAISEEMQARIDAADAAETARHRADSMRRAEVRRQAEEARANRAEKPLSKPGPSGPEKAGRALKNRAALDEEAREVVRKYDSMEACAAHEQMLRDKEQLRLTQIEERMEKCRIAREIAEGC